MGVAPSDVFLQDFLVEDRPISPVGDHLTGSLAEPMGKDSYTASKKTRAFMNFDYNQHNADQILAVEDGRSFN